MDRNCGSSSPDCVNSLMSTVPVDSCMKVTVSGNTELPLTAQSSGLSKLASSKPVLDQSDIGGSCKDESDDWKKGSYFNPTTGTSIIRITSEMFKKSRASSSQAEQNSCVEVGDLTQRCKFEPHSHEVNAGEPTEQEQSVASSSGAGALFKGGSFGKVRSFETLHAGHSLDTLGNGKVERDSDRYTSDLLYIDDYDVEEKVINMDDKEEQTAWESVVCCQVKAPTNDLQDNKSVDVVKDPGSGAAQHPRKESSHQTAYEKVSGYLSDARADKKKTEAEFIDGAAIDITESAKSGWQENKYNGGHVTDYDKTVNFSSTSKSLGNEASDKKSKISPGPLRLTRTVKPNAQPESSYSVSTPSFLSAYQSDVNINNTVCQTSVSSITSILSLDSRSSNSDEVKGWTTDKHWPESSRQADSWTELEDSHTQSFELRTSPEKMSIDDLPLSKSDKPATSGRTETVTSGVTNRYGPSSYVELNHVEVGHAQSEKLKLMQDRKEKKLNRLKAGVIDSSQISGDKAKWTIEQLLDFINSKENEHGKSRKTSQKPKKQVTLPDKSQMKFVIKVTVTDEVEYNYLPDATSTVPNGFMTQNESKEFADEKKVESSLKETEESPNDSCSETTLYAASNGFVVQDESKACAETVEKQETDSSLALTIVSNGFQESEELDRSAKVAKKNKKEKQEAFQASSANVTVKPSVAVPEQALTDTVAVTNSSLASTSDSFGETITADDTESNKDFTVVQKKRRNKTVHAEKSQTHRAKIESLDIGRSRMQNVKKVGDNLKRFPLKHNQLAMIVDNKHPVHSTWSALLKDKPGKAEAQGKSSSGDSSETSSVCSASVRRESTSFTKAALTNTVNDANSHSTCETSEASICFCKSETRTLQSSKNACELQLNADTCCDGMTKPVVAPYEADQHRTSSHDATVIPSNTDDGSREDCSTIAVTDTKLGGNMNKVSLPEDKIASFQSSTSCQEMKLSSSVATESNGASGRPAVVFDTREKSRFLTPASDIEISFGFDADVDEGTSRTETQHIDSTAIPTPQEAKSSSMRCPQLAPDSANCNVAVDINCNHQHFQGSINKSAVIALPSHGFQPGASHMPLIYSSPHPLSLGIGYVMPVPVPVGIVPPFVTCNNRPPAPATVIPRPAFESKDIMEPPELPDASIESISQKQEQEQSGPGICELVPAQLMVLPVPQELPNTRRPESSKLKDKSRYFDLVAAQAFLYSEFEAATAPGSGIVYLTIND